MTVLPPAMARIPGVEGRVGGGEIRVLDDVGGGREDRAGPHEDTRRHRSAVAVDRDVVDADPGHGGEGEDRLIRLAGAEDRQ